MSGKQQGTVVRMFGANAVQVVTVREKLLLDGFPAKPTGTVRMQVRETWPTASVVPANWTQVA